MKKLLGMLMVGALALSFVGAALARPPYAPVVGETYGADNAAIKAAAAGDKKCNMCHEGMDKKNRNEFGKALSKTMTKDEFMKNKDDKDALVKALKDALKKTESEKNAAGKTFGELIKAGMLPGGELK